MYVEVDVCQAAADADRTVNGEDGLFLGVLYDVLGRTGAVPDQTITHGDFVNYNNRHALKVWCLYNVSRELLSNSPCNAMT